MSKLTGPEILKQMENGHIVIDPFNPDHVNPNSVDLTLGKILLVYKTYPEWSNPPDIAYHRSTEAALQLDQLKRKDSETNPCGIEQRPLELAQWSGVLDMAERTACYRLTIPEEGLVLVPGRLYLGSTVEYTETRNFVPCIEGRSSIGRLGINIHSTAGFGDIGFCGTWTLELSVVEPVRVYAGVRFAQIHYDTPWGQIKNYESEKYQGQRTPRASGLWKEFEKNK